jgi:hypothetical protein
MKNEKKTGATGRRTTACTYMYMLLYILKCTHMSLTGGALASVLALFY